MKYHHRQLSFFIIAILVIGWVINVIFIFTPELLPQQFKPIEKLYQASIEPWKFYAYAINVLIFLIMINFCAMSITIDKQKIAWSFLLKIPSKYIPINNIESVAVVRNSWWSGWGVRKVAKGWMYNVSGFDAIEIVEKSGKVTRLGSNDVKNLARKLDKELTNSNVKVSQHG